MKKSLSVAILDTTAGELENKYEFIPNYNVAHLLARLEMQNKKDMNKLVVILPGWNMGIEGEDLLKAQKLAIRYAKENEEN